MKSKRVAVIGAGPAGLYAAHLSVAQGWQTALYESHSKPGGCASFFRRKSDAGDTTFDAGATILNGFNMASQTSGAYTLDEGFMRKLHRRLALAEIGYQPVEDVVFKITQNDSDARFKINARTLESWIESLCKEFADDSPRLRDYLNFKAPQALALSRVFARVPHLPFQSFRDLCVSATRGFGELSQLFFPLLSGFFVSLEDELLNYKLGPRFRQWLKANLLITLQCEAREVHPLYGALVLFFYPLGSGVCDGGMKEFFSGLLEALKVNPLARVEMRSPVERVTEQSGLYFLKTHHGTHGEKVVGPFDVVLSSIPHLNTIELLIGNSVNPKFKSPHFHKTQPYPWSALVAYLTVKDSPDFEATAFNAHLCSSPHSCERDAYLSFSARDNLKRAPRGYRSLTVSAHINSSEWTSWERQQDSYKEAKALFGEKLLEAVYKMYPRIEIVSKEFGTPQTFWRYTRRYRGSVGGLALTYENTFFKAPPQRLFGGAFKNVLQIGDTAFPGQSIQACAVGAAAAIEKIGGKVF